jgi:hypothetical protein
LAFRLPVPLLTREGKLENVTLTLGENVADSIHLVVALPIKRSRPLGFDAFDHQQPLQTNIQRLLGRSLKASGVLSRIVTRKLTFKKIEFEVRVIKLKVGNHIALCIARLPETATISQIEKWATRQKLQPLLVELGLTIANEAIVDGVIGIALKDGHSIDKIPDHWIKTSSQKSTGLFNLEITAQLVSRIAMERELLTWATQLKSPLFRPFWAGYAGFRVRRWPVELLTDRSSHNQLIQKARENFNLKKVRLEVLDQARSWWVVLAAILAVVGLVLNILAALEPSQFEK